VILGTPEWKGIDDFLEIINSLIEERAEILKTENASRAEEIGFYLRCLAA
jgi:hypothetical protein